MFRKIFKLAGDKVPKEPLTPQEEKIKQFKKKHLKTPLRYFIGVYALTMILLVIYNVGVIPAGEVIMILVVGWALVIIIFQAATVGIMRFTVKTYFEELKYKDL